MSTSWKTLKGDEWDYKSRKLIASADLNLASNIIDVRHLTSTRGALQTKDLYEFIIETLDYFKDIKIRIRHDSELAKSSFYALNDEPAVSTKFRINQHQSNDFTEYAQL